MLVTQETQNRIDELPLPLRMAANALLNALENLVSNKCDNEEILRTMSDFNDFAQGKYREDDLVNYDEACKILGFSTSNRVGLKRELDKNGIKQVVINNQRVGFPRHKVEALLHKKK